MLRIFLSISAAALLAACAGPRPVSAPAGRPQHHADKGFRNVPEPSHRHGFNDLLRWRFGLGPREVPPIPPEQVPPYRPESVRPDLRSIRSPDPARIQITWIGHSSFLIQADGRAILTDPVFSERVSPVSFLGPRRQAPPGLRFEDLPPIDAVLISHDHYDHLDAATIARLGPDVRYFVPLGLAAWFGKRQYRRVSEMDWGDVSALGPITIHMVPAQHFSGRAPFAFNRTLWAGYVIETRHGRIYFAGDTGYSPHFAEIAARFGPIAVALLPIGAYRPWWFMRPMHMDPAEAVRASLDLGAAVSVPMHWGTFRQSDEPMGEPPLYLKKALRDAGVPEERFPILKFGQTLFWE
jgi:N-acyl-phosphatidylethanolamine-hydrolysing phospholipase D